MMRRRDLIARAAAQLLACSSSPRLDAELLLAHVLGLDRTAIRTGDAIEVAPPAAQSFDALLARRRAGEPIAYLLGVREFWSLPLRVTPAVLVPRPETELLVELALARLPRGQASRVLDLGTGSGAIALAIARERPDARVFATDVSPAALEVAQRNAREHGLQRVEFRQGDWFGAIRGERFDLIACNPPYVAADDAHLPALAAEPRGALIPGPTGLEAHERIIPAAPGHLRPGGWLLLEHGAEQAAAVQNLLERHGFHDVTSHPDYSGIPRVTLGSLSSHMQGPS